MITLKQAKELKSGTILYHATNKNSDGTKQRWRVNGNVQTWKRDMSRVRVPLKHGLYTYGQLTEKDLHLVSIQL